MLPTRRAEQLYLLIWLLGIVGLAMAIPGVLVFGIMAYVTGYIVAFSALIAAVLVFGGGSSRSDRHTRGRADFAIFEWD